MINKILNDIDQLNKVRTVLIDVSMEVFFYDEFEALSEEMHQFLDIKEKKAIQLFIQNIPSGYDDFMKKQLLQSIKMEELNFDKIKFLIQVIWEKNLKSPAQTLHPVLVKLLKNYNTSISAEKENVISVFEMLIDILVDDPAVFLIPEIKNICKILPSTDGDWDEYYDHIKKSFLLLSIINNREAKNILKEASNSSIEEIKREALHYLNL